jgi:hypothetical protein
MQKIARRTFLMSAGAAPLAFALNGRAGANDRIRAAIIAMGDRGRDHVELLSRMVGVEIATFCDPDEHRFSNEEAGRSSGVFFYGSKGYMAVSPDQQVNCTVFLGDSKQPQPE